MLILNKTRINILVDVHFLIPTFQVVLIHINKVGNRINKVGHETTKWVNESTKWVNESTSWTAPNQPGGSRQLYEKSKSATEATAKKVIVQQYKGAKKIVTETNFKKNK